MAYYCERGLPGTELNRYLMSGYLVIIGMCPVILCSSLFVSCDKKW